MYNQMYNSHQRKGDRVYGLDAITLEEAHQKQRFSPLRGEIRASGSALVKERTALHVGRILDMGAGLKIREEKLGHS